MIGKVMFIAVIIAALVISEVGKFLISGKINEIRQNIPPLPHHSPSTEN